MSHDTQGSQRLRALLPLPALAEVAYKLVDHQPSQHIVIAYAIPGAMGTINLVLLNLAKYHIPCISLLYLLFYLPHKVYV